jgi:hypothetical protein
LGSTLHLLNVVLVAVCDAIAAHKALTFSKLLYHQGVCLSVIAPVASAITDVPTRVAALVGASFDAVGLVLDAHGQHSVCIAGRQRRLAFQKTGRELRALDERLPSSHIVVVRSVGLIYVSSLVTSRLF